MTTFYTSDLHFGHGNIIDYSDRPFDSIEHMNEEMIVRWNETVLPTDEVYVLGDVALGKRTETVPLAGRLNGKKKLVRGNHDTCWCGHRKVRQSDIDLYAEHFELLPNIVEHTLANGIPVRLCHFPYSGDSHDEDRFTSHRPVNDGTWLLHGHVHEKFLRDRWQINVGVDVWDFYPVNEEWIIEMIMTAPCGI